MNAERDSDPSNVPTSKSKASSTQTWARALAAAAALTRREHNTFAHVIDDLGARFGDAPALISHTETFSHAKLAARARQYARWAASQGATSKTVIGLLMPNRPEFLAAWVGISRTGAVASLLNTELPAPSLAHCLRVSEVSILIADRRLADRVNEVIKFLEVPPSILIEPSFAEFSDEVIEDEGPTTSLASVALHIFTSGTTGLPKAALISHRRILSWVGWFSGLTDATATDRMYNCLPMCHSVGGIVAIGSMLLNGGSVVIRERFSARAFWTDVCTEGCTVFQYIGELCRYLLRAAPHEDEANHNLRLVVGNGLQIATWEAFQARFKPKQIIEFYAATEGTFSLYNIEGRPGSIGRFPAFVGQRPPAILVRVTEEGDIVRNDEGRAVLCATNDTGEALGRIEPGFGFDGYTNPSDTDRKIAHNIVASGDMWFRTGDLMSKDPEGFFYFVDRIGDTFRWKGENVATFEVAEALIGRAGISECCVYGVSIPGIEGRAGMAVVTGEVDPSLLYLEDALPSYAQPVFLRIVVHINRTDTFKYQRAAYQGEGFDPDLGEIYWRNPASGTYTPLSRALHASIVSGDVRL